MKIFIFLFIFVFFLLGYQSPALAACQDSNAFCIGPRLTCGSQGAHDSSGTCMVGVISGRCCTPGNVTPTPASSTNYSWGSWGVQPSGTSLSDFKNLFGSNAPRNAPKGTWQSILSTIISLLFIASIILALAYLILGGYGWIMSRGDKQKLFQARERVILAIVGLVIVFLSILVIQVLGTFFKINFLNIP